MNLKNLSLKLFSLIMTLALMLGVCAQTISAASALVDEHDHASEHSESADNGLQNLLDKVAKKEAENDTINYVALGDSMTNGYGHPGYYLILQKHVAEYHDKNTGLCLDPSANGNGLDQGSPSNACPFFYGNYVEDTRLLDWSNNYGYLSNAPEAYPTKLSNLLETSTGKTVNQLNLAISGMRAEELRFMLDIDYYGDGYTGKFFRNDASITGSSEARLDNARQNSVNPWNYDLNGSASHQYLRDLRAMFGATWDGDYCKHDPNLFVDYPALGLGAGNQQQLNAIALVRTEYKYALENADLVTVALGTNNFGTGVQSAMYRAIESAFGVTLGDTTDFKYDINDVLTEFPELADLYPQVTTFIYDMVMDMPEIVGMFETEEDADKAVKDIVNTYSYGLLGFIANYKESLKLIREMNPDATIVVVGAMNIEEGIHFVVDGKTINFGDLYGTIVDAGNAWLAGHVAGMDNVYYSETEELSLIVDEIANGNWNSNMLSLMAADFAWNSDRGGDMAMRLRTIRALNTFGIHNEKVLKVVEAYLADPEDEAAVAAMNAEAQKMVDRYTEFGDRPTAGSYHVDITLEEAVKALNDYYIAMHLLSAMEEAAKDPFINMDSVVTWFKDNGFKAIFTNIDLLDDEGIQDLLYFYTRMMFANGAGVHPSVAGHEAIAKDILKSLETGRSGAEDAANKKEELTGMAKDALLGMMKTKYPELYASLFGADSIANKDDLALIFMMLELSDSEALADFDLDALEADLRAALREFEDSKTPEEVAAAKAHVAILMKALWKLAVKVSGTEYVVNEDSYYVSFGDSNLGGLGLDGYEDTNNEQDNNNGIGQYIEDSAPALLAKELFGENWKEHFAPYTQGGIRAEDLYYILGGDVTPDQYYKDRIVPILYKENLKDTRADYIATLQKADLISFTIGGGNVSTFVGYQLEQVAAGKPTSKMDWASIGYKSETIVEIKELIANAAPIVDALDLMDKYVPEGLDIENPAQYAAVLLESVLYGYASYNYYYTLVLEQIREINPDAQLLIVGMFNPVDEWEFTMNLDGKETLINIGGIATNVMDAANLQSLAYALSNDNVSFVDVRDTETFLDAACAKLGRVPTFGEYFNGVMAENGKAVHANKDGHRYIFKQMFSAIYGDAEEEMDALLIEFYNVLNDTYLTSSEKVDLLAKIYNVLEGNNAFEDYPELAVVVELYDRLSSKEMLTDDQTMKIVMYVYGGALDGTLDEKEFLTLVYSELISSHDDETALAVAGEIYSFLKDNGLFDGYEKELAVLEDLYAAIDEYVSDAQAVDILDYLYATLLSGEVNKAALTNFLYTELIKNNDAETAMAIVEEVYAVLKASGYLKGLEEELELVEKLYAALGNYVSDAEFAVILDFIYNELNEGGIDEIELVQYLYVFLIASNDASTAVAIIGEVYSVLKAEGYLNAYANELKVVEEICVALDPFVSDEQVMQIVRNVYLAIIDGEVTNAEVRAIAKFIYFDVLAITAITPEPRTLAVEAVPGLAAITPATKIAIIETVYTILKDNHYIDSTPEMQAIEDLYNDLSDAELLTDKQILDIFDTVVETFVENEVIGEEEIADVAEQIVEDILLNEDIPTEDKIAIIEKVSGALADSNINAGVEVPTIPALPVIKDIQLALKAAGYLTDAQANDLLNYVYAMLTSGEITEDKLAAFAEYVYNEIFNREGLTAADKAEIVRIVYAVLEDHGYISQQMIVDALIEAVETLKTLVPEYYDEAYAFGYAYALENGYVAAAVAAIDAAIASVKSVDLDGYAMTDVSKANIVNELNAVVATLEELKAALANGNVADVNALVNTVLALEDDLYAHLENLKVFGIQAGINVYSMVIVPQIEIVINEVIPAVMLTVDNILQKAYAHIAAKIAEVYGIIIDVNATVEEIYAAVRDHIAHVMAGELTLSEDTFYLAIVDGDEAYADFVVDALNLSAGQYKKVAMSEVTAEDIARASFITVAYNGSSALDFALAQGAGYASEYIDGEFRADLNAYLANAFKDILTEQGMDDVSTALNGALDVAVSDILGNATVTELDWVALVGEENLAYVNELRAVIAAALTEAGLPDTYSETVDVVALLWDNAEDLGISDLLANFKQSFFYNNLGDNAYYTIDVPVRDIVDVAVDSALYEFISYNKNYSKTMLAINALNPDATVAVLGNYNRFDLEANFDLVFPEITFTVAEALEAFGFDGSAINAEILKVLEAFAAIEGVEINIFVAELVDIALGEYNNAVNYALSIELPVCDHAELLISALVDACNAYVYGFAGEISKTDVYTITIPMSDFVALVVAQATVVNDMIEAALATEIVIAGGTVTVEANDVLDSIANLTSIHPFVYATLYRNVYYVDISDAKVGGAEYIAAQILKALSITCEHAFDNACDADCNFECGYTREVADHVYDHDCDVDCNECGATRDELVHYDDNKDHICDNCDTVLSECADADKDHKCDYCGTTLSECADADKDHKCDYCGATLSECADADKDHKCDYCGATLTECADADKDHKCDYCGATLSECADADKDHKCDYCGATLSECADANKDHKCDYCGAVLSECADADKDHKCDYCGATLSECADADKDHKCDYCGAVLSECADANKDHKCDLCGAVLSECADANKDHKCDYCGATLSECADADKDHKCDYCGAVLSKCADTDKDHKCDYCGIVLSKCYDIDKNHKCDLCGAILSKCEDANKDHKCDYCGTTLSKCEDVNKDHECDYCGAVLSKCADANKDHKCDYCGATLSECADVNKDHKCDYCGTTLSECADADKNHKCDYCGAVLSKCDDADKDHKCDYCGATLSNCADLDRDHKCDYCGATLSECADTNKDHKCDRCGAVLSECVDADKNHRCDICRVVLSECDDADKDHKCDYCGAVLSKCDDADKDHKCDYCGAVLSECADVVKNHKCDYCGATLSECADENNDHKCEYCGNTVSEHKWSDATCKAPKTCEICGKTEGKVADHQYGDWETVKEATKKEEGEQKKTCKVCGDTVTEAIPMLEKSSAAPIITAVVIVVVAGLGTAFVVLKKKKIF